MHALRSTRVVTPNGVIPATILIENGLIHEVAAHDALPNCPIEDFSDAVISPGLIDAHVHINEPGRTDWEGFETATRAAAAGGVTMLAEMPLNASPVTTNLANWNQKIAATTGKLRVDCGFYGGLVQGNADGLEAMLDAGALGIKAFLCDSGLPEFANATEADLREAMPILARRGAPLLAHAELVDPTLQSPASIRRYSDYMASRPPEWELNAIRLLIDLCREYRCHVHIVHLATAEALPMLRQAREKGLPLTVETCPHYLFFSSEEIADGDTRFKCAPPIRDAENRDGLWEGLRDGTIDMITSDHSPCPPALKHLEDGDFAKAWGGISSMQWTLPIVWTEAKSRGFDLSDMVRWTSQIPAQLIGLETKKGAIAPGFDADFVIWEPEDTFQIGLAHNFHRHKVTPYDAQILSGPTLATYLRGEKVFESDSTFFEPAGQVTKGKYMP